MGVGRGKDVGVLHSALADAGYVHPAGAIPHQPTAEGAVENSPEFKRNAQRLWNAVRNGQERAEAGNFVTRGGVYTDLKKEQNLPSGGRPKVFYKDPETTLAQIHLHRRHS